jgi:hypothetical protein
MSTVHAPMIGDLCVARVLRPKVIHITGPKATLCGIWALSKLSLPNARQAEALSLCSICRRIQAEKGCNNVSSC